MLFKKLRKKEEQHEEKVEEKEKDVKELDVLKRVIETESSEHAKETDEKEPIKYEEAEVGEPEHEDKTIQISITNELKTIKSLLEEQNALLKQLLVRYEEEVDEVDNAILRIVEEFGRITTKQLLSKVKEAELCSESTLFVHLRKLRKMGKLKRIRDKKEVSYTLPKA